MVNHGYSWLTPSLPLSPAEPPWRTLLCTIVPHTIGLTEVWTEQSHCVQASLMNVGVIQVWLNTNTLWLGFHSPWIMSPDRILRNVAHWHPQLSLLGFWITCLVKVQTQGHHWFCLIIITPHQHWISLFLHMLATLFFKKTFCFGNTCFALFYWAMRYRNSFIKSLLCSDAF